MIDLELREKVATRVMGIEEPWRVTECPDKRGASPDIFWFASREAAQEHATPLDDIALAVIPYEDEIDAAWQVVERMRELGYGFRLWVRDGEWTAKFHRAGASWTFINESVADTAPRAVCLAALAAMEAKSA